MKIYKRMGMKIKQSFYTITMLVFFSLLSACNLTLSKSANFDETKDSNYYLSQAEASSGSKKIDWQLLTVRALINENKLSQANSLLSQLPTNLSPEQQKDLLLSQGEIAIRKGQPFNLNQLSADQLNDSQSYRYYLIKLVFDRQARNIDQQAHDYLFLQKFASEAQQKQVLNNTWNFFSKLSGSQISKISAREDEAILKGWIDLSYVYLSNNKKVEIQEGDTSKAVNARNSYQENQLKIAILDWASKYPNHPAQQLVSMYTGQQTLPVDNVKTKKVALLLPFNGPSKIFGNTIRQGYVEATKFYPEEPQQNIVLLDTSISSMDSLLQQVKEQNVDLIVGPLLKENVAKIKQLAPAIPVLALNKVDDGRVPSNKMCFFTLSPEDEARDAAEHIFAQNKRKPLLIVTENDLGRRVAKNFAKQWAQIAGGSSQAYVQYVGSVDTLRSNMNHNSGIKLTGRPISFDDGSATTSSSYTGFDAIYVYASYDELTLIKPLLDLGTNQSIGNGSSAIALYSSSKSHVGSTSNDFNYEMNQTEYADIPLIVDLTETQSSNIPENIKQDYSLTRLYAMGIDAWRLANRFNQLDSYQLNLLDGLTGKLSTSSQCEVTRELSWQQYVYETSETSETSESTKTTEASEPSEQQSK